ncbi:hypothetical protein P168DRAFT_343929 [Aspergillus campestris IBT 28561]|uniref:STEEP1 domain-containing protein n=1 Tax=Aspergillus campestris (strain IBT 28561) TaxID=1392248 RepID=A0A2I1D3G3_ASPC2|nr:uncharacterized protein P168DRAFT_343929 [Aspergillus campestris IBT 28561]PKY04413.1 hypothetical protein P168DRAFT_343929 [Aspergillus campestris IBT 28561]
MSTSTPNNHNPEQDHDRDLNHNQPLHQENHQPQNEPQNRPKKEKLPIHTHHCRFCNHLLLATTLQSLTSLPTRNPPAKDGAVIVPLSLPVSSSSSTSSTSSSTKGDTDTELKTKEEGGEKKDLHTTILLSTTQPDRGSTIIRREDGFEKRRLIRCGRCRVVVGYFLDGVHFPSASSSGGVKGEGVRRERERRKMKRRKMRSRWCIYFLGR